MSRSVEELLRIKQGLDASLARGAPAFQPVGQEDEGIAEELVEKWNADRERWLEELATVTAALAAAGVTLSVNSSGNEVATWQQGPLQMRRTFLGTFDPRNP